MPSWDVKYGVWTLTFCMWKPIVPQIIFMLYNGIKRKIDGNILYIYSHMNTVWYTGKEIYTKFES